MYSTSDDKLPTRPVISSLSTSEREIRAWIAENNIDQIIDGDGQQWQLQVAVLQKPSPADLHAGIWEVVFKLSAEIAAAEFVKTGVLDAEKDARLLDLIGDRAVCLKMRPVTRVANSLEEARVEFIGAALELRKKIQSSSLIAVKRGLIARWIDRECYFGASLKSSGI